MKKISIAAVFLLLSLAAVSQTKGLTILDSLRFKASIGGITVNQLSNDTALSANSDKILSTQKALRTYIANHSGGFINHAGNADSLGGVHSSGYVTIAGDQTITSHKIIQPAGQVSSTTKALLIKPKDTIAADGIADVGLHVDVRGVVNSGHPTSPTVALQADGGSTILNNNVFVSGMISGDTVKANSDTAHSKKYIGVQLSDSIGNAIATALSPYENFIIGPLLTNDSTNKLIVNGSARIMSTPPGTPGTDSVLVKSSTGQVRAIGPVFAARRMDVTAWAYSSAFAVLSATRNGDEAIITASVQWPDGSTGTFTTDTFSSSFPGAIDAYHVTYVPIGGGTTLTLTQNLLTRDAAGAVTAQPALVVTP